MGVFTGSGMISAAFRQGGSVDSLWSPRKAGLHNPSRPSQSPPRVQQRFLGSACASAGRVGAVAALLPPQSEQRICLPPPSATVRLTPCPACLVLSRSLLILCSGLPDASFPVCHWEPCPFPRPERIVSLPQQDPDTEQSSLFCAETQSSYLRSVVIFRKMGHVYCFYGALSSTSKVPSNSIVFRRHMSLQVTWPELGNLH